MKKKIIYNLSLLLCAASFFACEEWTTPETTRVQHPDELSDVVRDDAYFARLRAYKQTDHKLAFGWFGSWSAIEASEQCRLRSAPDSMDIISMWSKWYGLSKAQLEDKAYVQKVKGTKVVFCISAKDMPEEFKVDGQITDEGIAAYAKAWGKDSMDKYEYDGIDIDFEMAIDHQGPLNTTPGAFKKFCEELSQYIGPKSETGRLFLIDGNIDYLDEGIAELCTYAVSQAYNCSGGGNLDGRTSSAMNRGWRADQIIFTENFESLWKAGGVTYTDYDGTQMPSLVGMASYARQKEARGFGSYHMEYEYGHSDMPYKYMRQAIQLANPAPKGDYTKTLLSINETTDESFTTVVFPSGLSDKESYESTLTATLTAAVTTDVEIPVKIDNSLVASYNDCYYTEYKQIDPSAVTFSGPFRFAADTKVSAEPVQITITNFAAIEDGDYLIPFCADFSKTPTFAANQNKQIKYLMFSKKTTHDFVAFPNATTVSDQALVMKADGTVVSASVCSLSANLAYAAPSDVAFEVVGDPALVAQYNAAHGTTYEAVAANNVSVSGKLQVTTGAKATSAVNISIARPAEIVGAYAMIAVRINMGDATDYAAEKESDAIKYILYQKMVVNVEEGATSIAGTPISDKTGWVCSVEGEGTGAIGGFSSAMMFNGDNMELGWYSSLGGKRWMQIDMAKLQTIAGWRLGMVFGNSGYRVIQFYDIQTSVDGVNWDNQSKPGSPVSIGAPDSDKWQYVKFYAPVECRYVRMTYENSEASNAGGFIGSSEFEAIAPNN